MSDARNPMNVDKPFDKPFDNPPIRGRKNFAWGIVVGCCIAGTIAGAIVSAYRLGVSQGVDVAVAQPQILPLAAATADSTDSMAVATGLVGEDAEGVFFLDFNTGDLQCLVYNPRFGAFGAHYYTNVRSQLGSAGKNSKYLLATGLITPRQVTAGARPGNSLVYVTDITTGMFAAYAIPWDRTMEASGRGQAGPLLYVGGGPIRNYQLPDPINVNPPAVVDPNANK
jgi:hypothetical protein